MNYELESKDNYYVLSCITTITVPCVTHLYVQQLYSAFFWPQRTTEQKSYTENFSVALQKLSGSLWPLLKL